MLPEPFLNIRQIDGNEITPIGSTSAELSLVDEVMDALITDAHHFGRPCDRNNATLRNDLFDLSNEALLPLARRDLLHELEFFGHPGNYSSRSRTQLSCRISSAFWLIASAL